MFLTDFYQRESTANRLPKHERLKNSFVAAIDNGSLRPGDVIPPEKVLAQSLGVARNTLRQALQELELRGLLQRIHGRGTFVDVNARQRIGNNESCQSQLYALIVPETHSGFYPSLLQEYDTAAREQNHQIIVCNSHNHLDKQAHLVLSLLDKRVAGVTIVPTSTTSTPAAHIRQFQLQDIPVVLCHRGVERIRAPLLSLPFREIGRKAAVAAAQHGHCRAAYITSSLNESSKQMERGLREAIREAGGDLPDTFVIFQEVVGRPSADCEQELAIKLARLCSHPQPPTVIFTSFDSLAEFVLHVLERLGVRVPDEMSLMGFGGANRQGPTAGRLTSIVVDERQTARRAIELLDEMRAGTRSITDTQSFELDVHLSPGTTLAHCRPRSS